MQDQSDHSLIPQSLLFIILIRFENNYMRELFTNKGLSLIGINIQMEVSFRRLNNRLLN